MSVPTGNDNGARRPIRVLLVAHTSGVGGTEVCFGRVLDALAADPAYEVHAAFPAGGALADRWGGLAPVIDYRAGTFPDTWAPRVYRGWYDQRRGESVLAFEADVARLRPDAIVSFTSVLTTPVDVGKRLGIPTVAYVREFVHPPFVRRWLWRYLSRRADRLIAISTAVRDHLEPYAPGRVRLVHDGVPLPGERRTDDWPPAVPRIGFYGGYDDRKGGEVFVRAARLVLDALPEATFAYNGRPHPSQEPFRDSMRGLAAELGLARALRFDESGEFASAFPRDTAVVMPSVREGLGLVALDAMSYGVPVVASRTGGLLDVVDDGVTGALVEVGDVAGFASAVASIAGDADRARAMGRASRERVERDFSLAGAVDGLTSVLHELPGVGR